MSFCVHSSIQDKMDMPIRSKLFVLEPLNDALESHNSQTLVFKATMTLVFSNFAHETPFRRRPKLLLFFEVSTIIDVTPMA